jgi:hypothetical protein
MHVLERERRRALRPSTGHQAHEIFKLAKVRLVAANGKTVHSADQRTQRRGTILADTAVKLSQNDMGNIKIVESKVLVHSKDPKSGDASLRKR